MKFHKQIFFAYLFFFGCLTTNVYATTYHYLSHPDLIGQMAGPDLFWQTGDDFNTLGGATGFNPDGHASGFIFNNTPLFGTIGGTFETTGTTVSSYNVQGTINDFADPNNPIISTTIFESLTPNTLSTFVVNADNTATANIHVDVTDGVNPPNSFVLFPESVYFHFNKGDDYNSIFAGPSFDILRSQIDFFVPLLPTDWETFFIGIETFVFFDDQGQSTSTGRQGSVFYTKVPEPSTIILMSLGLVGFGLARRK